MSLLQFVNNTGDVVEQGDVVVIASRQPDPGKLVGMPAIEVDLADAAYDTSVCGVVHDLYAEHKPDAEPQAETEGAAHKGRKRSQARASAGQTYTVEELATLDRTRIGPGQTGHFVTSGFCVACKVDADIAPIKAGDLLTTGPTKGHAQKVVDSSKAAGCVLGKALGSLKKGKGSIAVLVTLQ